MNVESADNRSQDQSAEAQRAQQAMREAQDEAAPGLVKEFMMFLKENKKWWLIPMIMMFLLFVALGILAATSPAITALIYPLI